MASWQYALIVVALGLIVFYVWYNKSLAGS